MKWIIFCLLESISFLTFGQITDGILVQTVRSDTLLTDSILVQTVRSDTLLTDSIQLFNYQLDSLTTILQCKKQEILILEQQIGFLNKKLSRPNIETSVSRISIVSDTILFSQQSSLDAKKDSLIVNDVEKRPIFFEVLSCFLIGRDSLAFQLHIKLNIPEEKIYISPALQGKVSYYVVGAQKKEVKLLSNIIIRDIVLSTGDNYITVKRKIDMKGVPKYETKILIIDDFGLSLQIYGEKRILYFPDNYEFWDKKRKITF